MYLSIKEHTFFFTHLHEYVHAYILRINQHLLSVALCKCAREHTYLCTAICFVALLRKADDLGVSPETLHPGLKARMSFPWHGYNWVHEKTCRTSSFR